MCGKSQGPGAATGNPGLCEVGVHSGPKSSVSKDVASELRVLDICFPTGGGEGRDLAPGLCPGCPVPLGGLLCGTGSC